MAPASRRPIVAGVAVAAVAAAAIAASAVLRAPGVPPSVASSSSPSPSGSFAIPAAPPPPGTALSAGVVVYGSTPSGIVAAVSAARLGASVIVVSGDPIVGGMMASGLGHADAERKDLVGGITREVFGRIGREEARSSPGWSAGWGWDAEPHVAQAAFETMLREARVKVYLNEGLDRTRPVSSADGRIRSFTTTGGLVVSGSIFIDASYEGDLMAAAGVPFTIGREARATYREPLAGVHVDDTTAAASTLVAGLDANGVPLPGAAPTPPSNQGQADGNVQAATYRLCVTDDPLRGIAFREPPGYDPSTFALLDRALATWRQREGRSPTIDSILNLSRLPNHKFDLNSHGLFSTDLDDGASAWSAASDADRRTIAAEHRAWVEGVLWNLESDPSVPAAVRSAVGRLGLCADEFPSTGGWPPILYVREARRMVGDVVLTQADIQTAVRKAGAVALGTYRIDSHFARRVLGADDRVRGDGALSGPTLPYQIPYAALEPPAGSVDNLLVSVTISASHVAWSSIRTEPTLMEIGEAAGVAAALAVRDGSGVHAVPPDAIRAILLERGGILAVPAVVPPHRGEVRRPARR